DQIKGLMQSKRPDLFGAPAGGIAGVPRPQVNMQQSLAGLLQGGPTGTGPDQTLPSPKAQMAEQTQPSPAVGALAVGGSLALGTAAAAPYVTQALKSALPEKATADQLIKVGKIVRDLSLTTAAGKYLYQAIYGEQK